MLHHRLRAAPKGKPLVFVGGLTQTSYYVYTDITVPLTSLTGGVDTAPREGDLVVIACGATNNINLTLSMSTSGYAQLAELYVNSTYDCNLGAFWKVMGASPDTEAVVSYGRYTEQVMFAVHVWRNAHATTPFGTATTATGTKAYPNPPSVTPTVPGSVIIAVGAFRALDAIHPITEPTGFENLKTSVYFSSHVAIASYAGWASGSYDPPAFSGIDNTSGSSWAAVSAALRPA